MEDLVKMTLNVRNNPNKVADMSLMECQCFVFSIFHLKNSNYVGFLCNFVEKLILGSALQPAFMVPRSLPSSRAPSPPPLQNVLRRPCSSTRKSDFLKPKMQKSSLASFLRYISGVETGGAGRALPPPHFFAMQYQMKTT